MEELLAEEPEEKPEKAPEEELEQEKTEEPVKEQTEEPVKEQAEEPVKEREEKEEEEEWTEQEEATASRRVHRKPKTWRSRKKRQRRPCQGAKAAPAPRPQRVFATGRRPS